MVFAKAALAVRCERSRGGSNVDPGSTRTYVRCYNSSHLVTEYHACRLTTVAIRPRHNDIRMRWLAAWLGRFCVQRSPLPGLYALQPKCVTSAGPRSSYCSMRHYARSKHVDKRSMIRKEKHLQHAIVIQFSKASSSLLSIRPVPFSQRQNKIGND